MGFAVDALLPSGTLEARAAARRLEAAGVDGLFAAETTSDPFLDLIMPAVETARPLLGTSIAVAFARSPFVMATTGWRLQALSKGRAVVGLGTQVKGHIERRFGMPWDAPGPRLREYVRAMKALWRAFRKEERLDFRGRFYTHTLLPAVFDPGPIPYPDPKVWLAAVNDYNCETIGLVADGFVVHPIGSPRYLAKAAVPAIERGLKASGRSRADVAVQAPVWLVVGDDDDQRRAAEGYVRAQIAWSGSTRTYRRIFEIHGRPELPDRLHDLMSKGDFAGMMGLITEDVLAEFAIIAAPEDAVDEVRKRYEPVADRLFFYNLLATAYASDDGRLRELVRALQT